MQAVPSIKQWINEVLIRSQKSWRMIKEGEHLYTGGLHTYKWGWDLQKYYFSKLSNTCGVADIVELSQAISKLDLSLETSDSEMMMIQSHPVFVTIWRAFTPYAVSFMAQEILASFHHELKIIELDRVYKIIEKEDDGGRSFWVIKETSEKKRTLGQVTITCNCSFY